MLPGFNTNVRYRGVLFHVQSEDSGRTHPHIITHLYHGGTIVFSEKSSYAELLDAPDLPSRVRERMEAQHRAVLGRLRAGAFDDTIRERLGGVLEEADSRSSTRPTAPAAGAAPSRRAQRSEPPRSEPADAEPARPFGEGIVSAKPLDEVILEYLVENARKRRQKPSS